jgi:hypothetical protein
MLNINAEAKEWGRDANFRGWRRYFYKVSVTTQGPENPRWCPYAKGSPREGQTPRLSNSVESRGSSPCVSGAPLLAPLGRSPPSPPSFRLKHCGPRSLRYTLVTVRQTWLSRSRKTLAPLGTITMARARAEGLCGFTKLARLTRVHLEQALKRSN